MDNPRIVFLDEYTINKADLSLVKSLGDYVGYEFTRPDEVIERCRDAQIVITNKTALKGDTLHQLPELKLICIAATGMNNVDLETASQLGIAVKNAVDYSTYSVAEQTIGSALALMKQTLYLDNFVKSGSYAGYDRLFNYDRPTHELHGKNWGVIGLGNIGRRVAVLAEAFGCGTAYYSTSGHNADQHFRRMELNELLGWADIISVHAPLSRHTYHLLNAERFACMKPSAIVINVARGSLIDEAALADALNNGSIGGAALDVYSAEPINEANPLNSVKDKYKLIMTPHSAWATDEALQRLVDKVAENIASFRSIAL